MSLLRDARWFVSGVLVVSLASCGGDSDGAPRRAARPASTAQLSADISAEGVRISPSRLGAGQVRIVVVNDTDRPVRPALVRAGGGTAPVRTDGAVAPGAVSAIVADVRRGSWLLRAGRGLRPAKLVVGRARPSSDDVLLLP